MPMSWTVEVPVRPDAGERQVTSEEETRVAVARPRPEKEHAITDPEKCSPCKLRIVLIRRP